MQPTSFTCSQCRAPLPPGVTRCPNCGLAFASPVPPYPMNPPQQKKTPIGLIIGIIAMVGCLPMIAIFAAILFPVFSAARDKAREASAASNIKQICIATMQYSMDHDGKLPKMDTQDNFKACLSEYIKSNPNADVFLDPKTKSPYILNASLSEKNLVTIANPQGTELIRSPGDYRGYIVVGYADGHVKAVPKGEMQ